jgi:hypothetical protein
LADFNDQLATWQAEVADVRIHGTVHERPIDRFAREASALVCTLDQPSFHQAIVRERVVAEDWLVSLDANRYSVPWQLIGKTVQVVRMQDSWRIFHQTKQVAEHPILSGRYQLSVMPEHGPGAAARNARKRFSDPLSTSPTPAQEPRHGELECVEVRDLAVYDQTLEAV